MVGSYIVQIQKNIKLKGFDKTFIKLVIQSYPTNGVTLNMFCFYSKTYSKTYCFVLKLNKNNSLA